MSDPVVVTIDTETRSSKELWQWEPDEYFRIGGFSYGTEDKVYVTTKLDVMRDAILNADIVTGSNIHNFDFQFLLTGEEHIQMAKEERIIDSWTLGVMYNPPPYQYVNRLGHKRYARTPEEMSSWYNLDEQAYQLGVRGKSNDIKKLAAKWGGFDKIPLDDPEYCAYLRDDVRASRGVVRELLGRVEGGKRYRLREEKIAACAAHITRTGWRIDQEGCRKRAAEQEDMKQEYVAMLNQKYGMPLTKTMSRGRGKNKVYFEEPYKSPQQTDAGRAAIVRAFKDLGITDEEFTKTKTGVSLASDVLKEMCEGKGEELENLAFSVGALGGLRPLAQQLLDNMSRLDGRVHANITMLQRSGRWSTTKPGLTTFGNRDEVKSKVDKKLLLANSDDEVLCELDKSQCDARIVAAYSGDKKFAERFKPGVDAHLLAAWAVWGRDKVGEDKSHPVTTHYRNLAKAYTHGWGFGGQPKTLSEQTKSPFSAAQEFVTGMNRAYRDVRRWQDEVRREAKRNGYVTSDWGRRMLVQRGREFTQAPALDGQNGTRELMCDAMLDLPYNTFKCVVAQVHDAFVGSFPKKDAVYHRDIMAKAMDQYWKPKNGGMKMHFPVEFGVFADNWLAAHP